MNLFNLFSEARRLLGFPIDVTLICRRPDGSTVIFSDAAELPVVDKFKLAQTGTFGETGKKYEVVQ